MIKDKETFKILWLVKKNKVGKYGDNKDIRNNRQKISAVERNQTGREEGRTKDLQMIKGQETFKIIWLVKKNTVGKYGNKNDIRNNK